MSFIILAPRKNSVLAANISRQRNVVVFLVNFRNACLFDRQKSLHSIFQDILTSFLLTLIKRLERSHLDVSDYQTEQGFCAATLRHYMLDHELASQTINPSKHLNCHTV
jgi:hypothetical protein